LARPDLDPREENGTHDVKKVRKFQIFWMFGAPPPGLEAFLSTWKSSMKV